MNFVYFFLMMSFITFLSDAVIEIIFNLGVENRRFPYTQLALASASMSLIFGLHALLDTQ